MFLLTSRSVVQYSSFVYHLRSSSHAFQPSRLPAKSTRLELNLAKYAAGGEEDDAT